MTNCSPSANTRAVFRPVVPDLLIVLLCIAPLALGLFSIVWCLATGETKYFNNVTALSLLVNIGASLAVVYFGLSTRSGLLLTIVILGNMFIVPRLAQYLLFPDWVYFPFPTPLTLDEINTGVWLHAATIAVFAIGSVLASVLLPPKFRGDEGALRFSPYIVFLIFLLFLGMEFYAQNFPGMEVYNVSNAPSVAIPDYIKLIVFAISSDAALFMLAMVTLLGNRTYISTGNFLIVLAAACIFIFAYATFGSRGSGLRIAFILIACALCVDWRGIRHIFQVMTLIAFAIFGTVLIYPMAEGFRIGGDWGSATDLYAEQPIAVAAAPGEQATGGHLVNILNRLGNFDYIAVTASRDPEPACAAKYLNLGYVAKNVVNQFAPGDPFPEARVSTSNVFRICFGERDEQVLKTYHSEIWTLLGLSKAFFGSFALLGCAVAGFVAQLVANALRQSNHPWAQISYGYYLFIVPFSLLFSLGLDHTINTTVIAYIRLGIVLVVVQVAQWLLTGATGMARHGLRRA